MAHPSEPPILRAYLGGYALLRRSHGALLAAHALLRALFAGVWLGLLDREAMLAVADAYYRRHPRYQADGYNRSGLWPWERAMVERYFAGRRRLVLVGAGGGREVLALERRGFEVTAFECNAALVQAANVLLGEEGAAARVAPAPPDVCPPGPQPFDGLIVGWGAYMLVQGRARRLALLRSLRAQAQPGAPLLLSFFVRPPDARRFALIRSIAGPLRRLRGREPVDLGDDLDPEFVHHFSQDELAEELRAGGFTLAYFAREPYGHAVARAT